MSKTDKELATEIVTAWLDAWSGQGKVPAKINELPDLIQTVFDAVHKLPNEPQE
jgi:hypothetical protein